VPQKIKFTPEIPKTAAGKINRNTARAKPIELFGAKG
jgi:acyl-coenzyme A synthetase/AMP-(fatty) acid ligase